MANKILDPTINVRNEIKAAVKRLDDLRKVSDQAHRNEVEGEIRSIRREIKHFKQFIKNSNKSEAKRTNAIRRVDQANRVIENAAAETRASTLASQVTDTAVAANTALKAETDPIRKSIDDLRQSQWTIAGGTSQEKEHTVDTRAGRANWGLWVGIGAAMLFGITTMLFNIVIIGVTLYLGLRTS